MTGGNTIFKKYIEMEMQLRQFDRVRILYQKWLETSPFTSSIWLKFAELEALLGDEHRAKAIYELAIEEPEMDLPEVLWKAYIDFEYSLERFDSVRDLYEKLLQRTEHLKVWISYANFELSQSQLNPARKLMQRANKSLVPFPTERSLLFQAWLEMEQEHGDEESIAAITKRLPTRIKKKRQVERGGGVWEEYFDYIFPEDESSKPALKLLEMAHSWKQQNDK